MDEAFLAACRSGDVNEVRRLHSFDPELASRLWHFALVNGLSDVTPFLLSVIRFPDAVAHASVAPIVALNANDVILENYIPQFPDNLTSLWRVALTGHNDDGELALTLLQKYHYRITDFPWSIAHAHKPGVLDCICEQDGIERDAAKNVLAAFAVSGGLSAIGSVCRALEVRGVLPEIFLSEVRPENVPFIGKTDFEYLDLTYRAFGGAYDAWVRPGIRNVGLTNFLVWERGARLTGEALVWTSFHSPPRTLGAADLGRADLRECRINPAVAVDYRMRLMNMRVQGFTPRTFPGLPRDLRLQMTTVFVALRRGPAPMPVVVIFMLLESVLVAYSRDSHRGGSVLGPAEPCQSCGKTAPRATCGACGIGRCDRCAM